MTTCICLLLIHLSSFQTSSYRVLGEARFDSHNWQHFFSPPLGRKGPIISLLNIMLLWQENVIYISRLSVHQDSNHMVTVRCWQNFIIYSILLLQNSKKARILSQCFWTYWGYLDYKHPPLPLLLCPGLSHNTVPHHYASLPKSIPTLYSLPSN